MNIKLDEGYMYGIGLFETIAVTENHCILLKEHLKRLNKSLEILGLQCEITKKYITDYINDHPMKDGALKVMVSKENITITNRDNTYTKEQFEKGFILGISDVIRNETSPFTFLKSFNYGDNILEKRNAKEKGWDEPIFLNTKNQICEGATTNLFFIKEKKLYTPPISCGMLDGIIRSYILNNYKVCEKIIYHNDIKSFDEMFVTNSLLGIMPVKSIGEIEFSKNAVSLEILDEYQANKSKL